MFCYCFCREVVVFDEVHHLKNGKGKQHAACRNLPVLIRFGLTGTLIHKLNEVSKYKAVILQEQSLQNISEAL